MEQDRTIRVNMMPVIHGDGSSVPDYLQGYTAMMDSCKFRKGSTTYLTVNEGRVDQGSTQRRGGVHVESPASFGSWGGGWGGDHPLEGIYMASTDGRARLWDCIENNRTDHGAVNVPVGVEPHEMQKNRLYWMTDKTPHEALTAQRSGFRGYFRYVSEKTDIWWEQHSTKNPLGVHPNACILKGSKFN